MSDEYANRSQSLGRVAYDQLHEAIETGLLKSGDRISVNALAETLKISRTPVREAISWLETDGLIVHEPYVGRVVARLDVQMVNELYAMRLLLEVAAAGMAAQNASASEVAVLQEMVQFESTVLHKPIERERHNRAFHKAIYRSAHNRYLLSTLSALQTPMVLLGPATAADPSRLQSSYDEHVELVDCIARRDEQGARASMTRHLEEGQKARVNYLLRHQSEQR
jgi:DNA-binding GntR family transcriptional regulator